MKRYYILNLNNPQIRKLYNRFKEHKNIPPNEPCSDTEREGFERYILGDDKYENFKRKLEKKER